MTTLSLASMAQEAAARWPDKVALVDGERRPTFAQVWDGCLRVAGGLVAAGVGPGDAVALLAPNSVEFVVGYYGILAAGGTVVPVPTLLHGPEAAYLVTRSGARLVLHHRALAPVAQEAAGSQARALAVEDLVAADDALAGTVTRQAEDTAVIFFTSGTTGHPKGALLPHVSIVVNTTSVCIDLGLHHDDVSMAVLPLFHVFGQVSVPNTAMRLGQTLVLAARFEPVALLDLMVREGVTIFNGVPTMFVHLDAAARAGAPVPALKHACSGGAAIPAAVLEEFEQLFGVPIHEGYGLSETTSGATLNQDHFGVRPGSVGHGLWGVDVEVVDALPGGDLTPLPAGERGEVVVRGPNVFAGYLGDPDATAAALVDGWLRTGDIGVKDDDGFCFIVDRTKDLIIRGGFTVYPREVEEAIMRHPDVQQVAVVGVPDDVSGEEVCAVVVPRAGATIDPHALVAWCRERLGAHKYPRRVEVMTELPMGPSQKVLKRELRARLA